LGAENFTVTLSGFSGGSFQASYINVIFSYVIKGVGLISGGSYGATYLFNEKTDDLQNSINIAYTM
jgi:hypothetical protein